MTIKYYCYFHFGINGMKYKSSDLLCSARLLMEYGMSGLKDTVHMNMLELKLT